MAALNGQHTMKDISVIAKRHNVGEDRLSELLKTLSNAGVLLNARYALPHQLPSPARSRLRPDLDALTLSHGEHATTVMANRASYGVVLYGKGRIAPVIGAILASSGIGRVHLYGTAKATPADACVGGLAPDDEQRSYTLAAHDAIRRAAAEADTRAPRGQLPEFAILARGTVCGDVETPGLARRGVPHLPVLLREGIAIVGPLVVPGHTACLACLDLHRRDRDPAWPALASQLATSARRPEVSHTALVVAAAGLASAQTLAFLDGDQPTTLGACLELDGLGGAVRRRRWEPHPECGCVKAA